MGELSCLQVSELNIACDDETERVNSNHRKAIPQFFIIQSSLFIEKRSFWSVFLTSSSVSLPSLQYPYPYHFFHTERVSPLASSPTHL